MNLLALLGFTTAIAIPDPALTPGDISPLGCAYNHTVERFDGDTAAYYKIAKTVFASYQIPWEQRHHYELDHLVPRCLGGADTVRNLWPQPLNEAHKKDDNYEKPICHEVCVIHKTPIEQGIRFFMENGWAK